MIEFILGLLVGTYFLVLAFFIHDERPKRSNILLYIFWPITLLVGPFTKYVFKRWKYEYRQSTNKWDYGDYGWYLKPNRKPNDSWGWSETYGWFKRRFRRNSKVS